MVSILRYSKECGKNKEAQVMLSLIFLLFRIF